MLSPDEARTLRPRHIVLREGRRPRPGRASSVRACSSSGPAGLGAPVLLYLAAAGVGTLGIVDDDEVSLSNLQRQVIHGTPEIGAPKVRERRLPRSRGSIRM